MERRCEKLVRDNIPSIIEKSGEKANYRVLSDIEYKHALKVKMIEEVNELFAAITVEEITEELGDIQTVLGHLLHAYNISEDDFIISVNAKDNEKGLFMKRYFLDSIETVEKE